MVAGIGCLVMVGITLTLIWAAVLVTNPYSAALIFGFAVFSAIWQGITRKREK